MLRMNRELFERVVAEALDGLPPETASFLDNVAVVVEDEPSDEEIREFGRLQRERITRYGSRR